MGFLTANNRFVDPFSISKSNDLLNKLVGKGLKFPLEFSENRGGVFSTTEASGIEKINGAIYFVMTTRRGEYPFHPDFGCDLVLLLMETISPAFKGRCEFVVREAIGKWIPQINLELLSVQQDTVNDDVVIIKGQYSIRNTPFKGSFVFPFNTGSGGMS